MKLSLFAAFAAALALAGCSSSQPSDSAMSRNDLGTGANTVTRKYAKPAPDVWDAAVSAVKSYDLSIDSDRHDKMGGELVAHRAGGDKVTINMRSIDAQNTDVAVRVEPGNRNMANLIHEKIAEKAGMGSSKAGMFGDYSLNGTYPIDLKRSAAAAEAACRAVDLSVTNKEIQDSMAVVDAREANSNPVRVRMDRSGDAATKVTFSAGSAAGSDPKAVVSRLKAEFDRQVASAAER
jgi:hypothetical protein